MNRNITIFVLLACLLFVGAVQGRKSLLESNNKKLRGPASTAALLRFARVQEAEDADESEASGPAAPPTPAKKKKKAATGMTGMTGATGAAKKEEKEEKEKRDDTDKRATNETVSEENPIVAAYKEKMDLLEIHCNEAKDLTFNTTLHLNMSIATVQKYMTLANEDVREAKKSESEEEGVTTLKSLTESQKHASDAKHERKRLKALRDVLATAKKHEAKICERYNTSVEEWEAARTKVWKDKKQIYDEIKVLMKKSKRWLMREMAQAKKDVEAATAAQLNPATPPLVITHKILIVNNAIRASHSIKLYFDAIVKRFNKAEAEANAEHEKLYNKPMKEVIAKREAAAKAEEDDGPSWTNDFIEGLGKNATAAIAKAEESREFMANITGEDYVKPTNIMGASGESGASGASGAEAGSESGAAAQEMRFSQIFASGPGSPKNASAKNSSSTKGSNEPMEQTQRRQQPMVAV